MQIRDNNVCENGAISRGSIGGLAVIVHIIQWMTIKTMPQEATGCTVSAAALSGIVQDEGASRLKKKLRGRYNLNK